MSCEGRLGSPLRSGTKLDALSKGVNGWEMLVFVSFFFFLEEGFWVGKMIPWHPKQNGRYIRERLGQTGLPFGPVLLS